MPSQPSWSCFLPPHSDNIATVIIWFKSSRLLVLHYRNLSLLKPNQTEAEHWRFKSGSTAMSVWAQHMPVEITNMQHSSIKDRKRRAVKRAPKVKANTRAAKSKVFIRRNFPERLAEEGGPSPAKRKKTKIWKPAFQQPEQSHWVDLCHRWCWNMLQFGWLWG